MFSPLLIDLLIVAVLALSIFLGWTKGIVRGLLTLAAAILAIILAVHIADFATDLLIKEVIRPAAHTAIEEKILQSGQDIVIDSPLKNLENVINSIENDLVREKARELLSSAELFEDPIIISTKDELTDASMRIIDTVLSGAVRDIISAIISIICFFLISLALRPVIWMIEQAFKLPLLRKVNQIGGLISGTLKGILLILIVVWALRMTDLYITDEIIAQTYLLRFTVSCLNSLGFGSTVIV